MASNNPSTLTLDELYARLAREVGSDGFGGDDFKLLAARGKVWFREHEKELREHICPLVKEQGETAVALSALADAVSMVMHGPACYTASLIALQIGLKKFCKEGSAG